MSDTGYSWGMNGNDTNTKGTTMNFTTRDLQFFCDGCVRCGNYYMAAVACVALGPGYDWSLLKLSTEQVQAVRSLDCDTAMTAVCDYAWQIM